MVWSVLELNWQQQLSFVDRNELRSVRGYWNLIGHIDILYANGHKILQLAVFIPFFLTADSFTPENIYIAVLCIHFLHDHLMKKGSYYLINVQITRVTLSRIRVSLYSIEVS